MSIFLVRHGESTANLDRKVYSESPQSLIPLSLEGQKQSRDAGKRLHPIIARQDPWCTHCCIINSPYLRATQTARIIAKMLSIQEEDIRQDILLIEQAFGLANGSTISQLSESTPVEATLLEQEEIHYRPPRGESLLDVYVRAGLFVQKYNWFHNNSYIIVAHAGVCHMLEAFITGKTPSIKEDWKNGEIRTYSNPSALDPVGTGARRILEE